MRYLVNSEGDNIVSTTGQGVWLDDGMSLTIPISEDVATIVYIKDGVTTYAYDSASLRPSADLVITGDDANGNVFSNVIVSTDQFNTQEKADLLDSPETFLYVTSDTVTTASTITIASLTNWCPMIETGDTVYDLIASGSNSELVIDGDFSEGDFTYWDISKYGGGTPLAGAFTIDSGIMTFLINESAALYLEQDISLGGVSSDTYTLKVDIEVFTSSPSVYLWVSASDTDLNDYYLSDRWGNGAGQYSREVQFTHSGVDDVKLEFFLNEDENGKTATITNISIIKDGGGSGNADYTISNYATTCRSNAIGLDTGIQSIGWDIDVDGKPTGLNVDAMSFRTVQADQVVTTVPVSDYSIREITSGVEIVYTNDGSPRLYIDGVEQVSGNSVYLDDVTIPTYDSGDASHRIILSDGSNLSDINNAIWQHFYIEAGDYGSEGADFIITQSGVDNDNRRTLSLHNGNDTHPRNLLKEEQAILGFNCDSNYWIFDRISNYNLDDENAESYQGTGSYLTYNRFHLYNYSYGFYFTGGDYKTVQNNYLDFMTHAGRTSDNVGIGFKIGTNDTSFTDFKVLDNDVRDAGDGIQLIQGGSATTTNSGFPNCIIDGNRVWMDSDVYTNGDYDTNGYNPAGNYQIAENAIDLKFGSQDIAKPMIVTNNIMWGIRQGDPNVSGSSHDSGDNAAITIHYGCGNVLFDNNVMHDCPKGMSMSGANTTNTLTAYNWTVSNNIFSSLSVVNDDARSEYSNYINDIDNVVFDKNTFLNIPSAQGGYFFYFEGSDITDSTFVNNVCINVNNIRANLATDVTGNHMYACSNMSQITGTTYPTTAEALMNDYEIDYLQDTQSFTIAGSLTDELSPHYASVGAGYVSPLSSSIPDLTGNLVLTEVSQLDGETDTSDRTLYEVYSGIITP